MTAEFPLRDYDLDATLASGQTFRWRRQGAAWTGVIAGRWVRLTARNGSLVAEAAAPGPDWTWLRDHLRLDEDLAAVTASFPDDEPMRAALAACPGLRLLRQEPWECLASFILSSTKQIVQIEQCVALLCERFGAPVAVPDGTPPAFAFPAFERLAAADESALRVCKLGFRAKYLLTAARRLAAKELDLAELHRQPTPAAREALVSLYGVGRKIADCVLLFAYGRQDAFPVDVWVQRALRELYFPGRRPSPKRLARFAATHFGPNAGYAQQYLFHYVRTKLGRRPGVRVLRNEPAAFGLAGPRPRAEAERP